jgi:hypothetical protein
LSPLAEAGDPVKQEFLRKMHEDILALAKRRYTTSATKVIFIASLVGLGGIGKNLDPKLSIASYLLIPVVAMFWDLLFFEQNFALLRITTFIRWKKKDFGLEADWEEFIHGADTEKKSKTRKGFLYLTGGIILPTVLSMGYGFGKAYYELKPCPDQSPPGWFWFIVVLIALFWVIMVFWDGSRREEVMKFLEDEKRKENSGS